MEIKKRKQDVIDEQEEINAMTLGQVVKCAKYDLFKKVQFIRHKKILDEYESRGSIGRFVMKKRQSSYLQLKIIEEDCIMIAKI